MNTSKLGLQICLILLITAIQANAQKQWNQTHADQKIIYTPTDLPSGKLFNIIAHYPEELHGDNEKGFLTRRSKAIQARFGNSLGKWKHTTEKDGSPSMSIYYKDKDGKKRSNGFVLCKLDNNKVFVAQMNADADISLLLKYGLRYKEVIKRANTYFRKNSGLSRQNTDQIATANTSTDKSNTKKPINKNISTSNDKDDLSVAALANMTGKKRGAYIRRRIRTAPGKGLSPSQIHKIWLYKRYTHLQGKVSVNTYLLLKDGTVYTDCEIPPSELDVAASRKYQSQSPYSKSGKWTVWRRSGNGYQIKKIRTGEWETLKGNEPVFPKRGTRINQKFISASGSQTFGVSKRYITFFPDGRFETSSFSMNDNSALGGGSAYGGVYSGTVQTSDKKGTRGTTVVSGSSVGGGTRVVKNNGDKNQGTYEFKNDYILLKHDNGWVHAELFLFENSKRKGFVYGDRFYWIPKND